MAKNEEALIEQAVGNLLEFCDEVVVGDTGSADDTPNIAEAAGAHVTQIAWKDDFASARNDILDYIEDKFSRAKWVIFLDCDEMITAEDCIRFKDAAIKASEEVKGYSCISRHYTNDSTIRGWRHTLVKEARGMFGFFDVQITRMFRLGEGFRYKYKIHELVDPSIEEKGGVIELLKLPIHHYGFTTEEKVLKKKRAFYEKLGKSQIKETPDDPKPHYELALIYKKQKKDKEAIELFEKSAKLDAHYKYPELNIAEIFEAKEDAKNAEKYYELALASWPEHTPSIQKAATFFIQRGQMDKAMDILKDAIDHGTEDAGIFINYGVCFAKNEEHEKAREQFLQAARYAPVNPKAWMNLALSSEKTGKYEDAIQAYAILIKLKHPKSEEIEQRIAMLRSRMG